MLSSHTLWPETINILGNTQQMYNQRTTIQYSETQEESTNKQTWWGRFKFKAKKVFDKFKPKATKALEKITEAVVFIKEYVAPILTATASFLRAWGFFKRSTDNRRYTTCAS